MGGPGSGRRGATARSPTTGQFVIEGAVTMTAVGAIDTFDMLENEAKSLVEKKISLPAYDQCLKASHVFNILDARGTISVAQRAEYIGRIREITKSVATIWIDTQI